MFSSVMVSRHPTEGSAPSPRATGRQFSRIAPLKDGFEFQTTASSDTGETMTAAEHLRSERQLEQGSELSYVR